MGAKCGTVNSIVLALLDFCCYFVAFLLSIVALIMYHAEVRQHALFHLILAVSSLFLPVPVC